MKDMLPVIRNMAFFLMIVFFFSMWATLNPKFDIPCNLFGASGVVVLLLTIAVGEPRIQKVFFILAGVAGTAALITLNTFKFLSWIGHQPGGDGGGITVPMLIVVCPILFLIGSIGSIVCLIRSAVKGAKTSQPD
jgi:hypothetical protein